MLSPLVVVIFDGSLMAMVKEGLVSVIPGARMILIVPSSITCVVN